MVLKPVESFIKFKAGDRFAEGPAYLVEALEDGVAIKIEDNGEFGGYVFIGRLRVAADTIFHTKVGALGRSTELEVSETFIAGGKIQEKGGSSKVKDADSLLEKAGNVIKKFRRKRIWDYISSPIKETDHIVFSPGTGSKRNLWLISRHEKLVVIHGSEISVSDDDESFVHISREDGIALAKGDNLVQIGRGKPPIKIFTGKGHGICGHWKKHRFPFFGFFDLNRYHRDASESL